MNTSKLISTVRIFTNYYKPKHNHSLPNPADVSIPGADYGRMARATSSSIDSTDFVLTLTALDDESLIA